MLVKTHSDSEYLLQLAGKMMEKAITFGYFLEFKVIDRENVGKSRRIREFHD